MSDDCGCCATQIAAVPGEIENRPWLSAIGYRIGTFATFRKAIVDELSRTPELAGLTSRVSDDYTITAIELWSAVADVLTFYQERVANEAFLRTVTLRDSVLRLVRLIDYELRPGSAATTALAFTLDAGARALIPVGTRAQSVPGQGETPQKFETLAPLMADARFNKLRLFPVPGTASPTSAGMASAIVAPDADALLAASIVSATDRVMLYSPGAIETLTVREVKTADDLLFVSWLAPIAGTSFAPAFDASDPTRRAYKLGRSFHLFGYDAPDTVVVPEQTNPADPTTTYLAPALTDYSIHGDGTVGDQLSLDARAPGLKAGATILAVSTLGGVVTAIPFRVSDASEAHVSRTATAPTAPATKVTTQSDTVTQLKLDKLGALGVGDLLPTGDIRDVVVYELLGDALRFWPFAYAASVASSDVVLAGRRSGWASIEVGRTIERGAYKGGTTIDASELAAGRAVLLTDANGGASVAATIAGATLVGNGVAFAPASIDTDTVKKLGLGVGQAIPIAVLATGSLGATIAFPNARRELSVTIGAFPTQTVTLDAALIGSGAPANVAAAIQSALRATLPAAPTFARAVAWVAGDAIVIAPGVAGDRVSIGPSSNDPDTIVALALDAAHVRWLDGVVSAPVTLPPASLILGTVNVAVGPNPPADRFILTFALGASVIAAALATFFGVIAHALADGHIIVLAPPPPREPRSFLRLSLALETPVVLDASSALLLGNVAPASHGETVRAEVLGDGDASQSFQHFALKKKPVTYLPAAIPGGIKSSLTVSVNGVRWSEAATLYGASPNDQVYVTQIADDGTLTVQFGDGLTGARPASGRQNIVATYRQGTGLAGRVGASRITTLLDRPTGVKGVTNLVAADGGADPETMAKARASAPGTVRTFGRAVSLRDFEDTALMAGEVAKAAATWVWTGERRAIHLTVAAQGGGTFSAEGLKRLAATLATERDPNHKLLIDNYAAVAVLVDASVIVDDRYVSDDVLAASRAALLGSLSFDQRVFAQPVYLSDVFRVLQDVEGVVAVDVNALDLKSSDPAFRAAHGVDPSLGQPQPHLIMLPARPVGSSGTVLAAELAYVEVPVQDVTLRAIGGLST